MDSSSLPGLSWSSVLKPTWPCNSIGLDCAWEVGGRLLSSFIGAQVMATVAGGSLHRVWTPIRVVSGLFYPPFMVMAGLDLARNAYTIASTSLHLPWLLPKTSSGASAGLASGELNAARQARIKNDHVFWNQAKNTLKTEQGEVRNLLKSQNIDVNKLQQWFATGCTASNIHDFELACHSINWYPDDGTIQHVLTEFKECYTGQYDNVAKYLTARDDLDSTVKACEAKQTALASTQGTRAEAVQVSGIRTELRSALINTAISTGIASIFALNALKDSFSAFYGNSTVFADQVMGATLESAEGVCNAAGIIVVGNLFFTPEGLFSDAMDIGGASSSCCSLPNIFCLQKWLAQWCEDLDICSSVSNAFQYVTV